MCLGSRRMVGEILDPQIHEVASRCALEVSTEPQPRVGACSRVILLPKPTEKTGQTSQAHRRCFEAPEGRRQDHGGGGETTVLAGRTSSHAYRQCAPLDRAIMFLFLVADRAREGAPGWPLGRSTWRRVFQGSHWACHGRLSGVAWERERRCGSDAVASPTSAPGRLPCFEGSVRAHAKHRLLGEGCRSTC